MVDNNLEEFFWFYKEELKIGADRVYGRSDSWKIRAFAYAAVRLMEYSINKAAQIIKKDHTTLMYHLERVTDKDMKIAKNLVRKYYMNEKGIYLYKIKDLKKLRGEWKK